MISITIFSQCALNLSLYFYLAHYVPQVWHNRNAVHLQEMSLWFHSLLLLCYASDLIYAVAYPMPWQYQLVSVVGTACLGLQQYQISRLFAPPYLATLLNFSLLLALLLALVTLHFLTIEKRWLVRIEFVSQISAFIYMLPQLIHNQRLQSAKGLSIYFLLLNLGCIATDNIAAWGLDWPAPNKLGSGCRLVFIILLLIQYAYYQRVGSSVRTTWHSVPQKRKQVPYLKSKKNTTSCSP